MTITKQKTVDLIEVLESGLVQVRTTTRIVEDGLVISQFFHRHVITPGDSYECEDARVQIICAAVHTDELIKSHNAVVTA